jgi:predicted DNA-binding protein
MNQIVLSNKPKIQFPLRISNELNQRFNEISSNTKIPKSTLGRLAISYLLSNIEQNGIVTVLNEIQMKN